MQMLFDGIVEASAQTSVLVALVVIAQLLVGRRLTPRWRCGLWTLAFLRLLAPALPESRYSLFNLLERPEARIVQESRTAVTYGDLTEKPQPTDASQNVSKPSANLPSAGFHISIPQTLAGIWLAGVLGVAARLLIAAVRLSHRLRQEPSCADPRLLELLADCSMRAGIRTPPRLIQTKLFNVPALCGIFRPTVLLPVGLTQRLCDQELRFVLLHELVHLKRRDVATGWAVWLLNAIHWFNPLLWWAAARFRADRELACDCRVVQLIRHENRLDYAQTILKLLEGLVMPTRMIGAAAMLEGRSSLRRRIADLANPIRSRWIWSVLGGSIVLLLIVLTFTRSKPATRKLAELTTQSYDVRELVAYTADHNPRPTGALTTRSGESATHGLPERLISRIRSQVDPSSWQGQGGAGTVQYADNTLVVTQTPANQAEVGDLLRTLQRTHGIIIQVEVRVLDADFDPASASNGAWIPMDGFDRWSVCLTDAQRNEILKAILKDRKSKLLHTPRLTLEDGHRGHMFQLTGFPYVANLKPTVGGDGKISYEPVMSEVRDGIDLECGATVQPDGTSVSVNLQCELSDYLSMKTERWAQSPADRSDLNIQVPTLRIAAAKTTLDLPSNQSALLRLRPKVQPSDSSFATGAPKFLLVTATIWRPGGTH